MLRYPDLICLGAQKSATTWLYDVLKGRREIFLPPIKEVHYFSQIYNSDAKNYGPVHRAQQTRDILSSKNLSDDERSYLKHLSCSSTNDEWYGKIFAEANFHQTCFEICPSYMNMPQAAVQHVLRLNPSVRLLVIIRDPVERCWSQIRMHVSRGDQDRDFESFVRGDSTLWPYIFYTDYASSLRRWERYTSPGQLKLILHDDVLESPHSSLTEIYDFVGLAAPQSDPSLSRTVFKGEAITMPPRLRQLLLKELHPQYQYLRQHFPGAVSKWLSRHEEALR